MHRNTGRDGIHTVKRRLISAEHFQIDQSLVCRISECEEMIQDMESGKQLATRLRAWAGSAECAQLRPSLYHRLSERMQDQHNDLAVIESAEHRLYDIYEEWLNANSLKLADASHAMGLENGDIDRLGAAVTGPSGGLRRGPICIRSQDGLVTLPMPDWLAARHRIEDIPRLVSTGALGTGIVSAVRTLVLVYNAHAFRDGNGRLGRSLMNYCLHRSGMPRSIFLPLKMMYCLSRGGFELSLREAELFGRWSPVVAYHCQIVSLLHHVSRSAPRERTQVV